MQNEMYLLVLFCSGVHRTLYRTSKDSLSGGMSLKIDRKQLKKEFFLVKWLTLVYREPVNPSLTIGSAKYCSPVDRILLQEWKARKAKKVQIRICK